VSHIPLSTIRFAALRKPVSLHLEWSFYRQPFFFYSIQKYNDYCLNRIRFSSQFMPGGDMSTKIKNVILTFRFVTV